MGAFSEGGFIGPIFERRAERKRNEAAGAERARVLSTLDIGVDELVASTADPERAAAFNDQFKAFKSMALSADKEMQQQGLAGLSQLGAAVREGIENQRTEQRGLVVEAAKDMREKAQAALKPMRELQADTEQLNALLADPDFDQNMALNRGTLIALAGSTARQMLTDPEDFADALRAVNGGGLINSLVGLVGGTIAAQDFDFLKEDYRRLAEAAYVSQQKKYQATVAPIARDAAELEAAAGQLDVFPPGYSLSRYVLSDPEDFENPLQRSYPEPLPAVPTLGTAASGVSRFVESLTSSDDRQPAPERDSAVQPLPDVSGALYSPTTPRELSGLFGRMTAQPQGTTFRMDPKTGRVYSFSPDGQRRELETTGGVSGSGGERAALLNWMRARTGN